MKRRSKALLAATAGTLLIGAIAIGCGDDAADGGATNEGADGAAQDGDANARDVAARGDALVESGANDADANGPADAATDDAAPQDADTGADTGADADAGDDASSDADAGADDGGADAGDLPCVIVGQACSPPAGGVCKGSGCATCIDKTDDALCTSAYGAGHICVGSTCIVGNCHKDADCTATAATPACSAGTCSACDAPSGNVYVVDPVNGSDSAGTGATSGVCAFKTVSKAIAVVSALAGGPPAGTQIQVKGPNNVSGSEALPWVVPANTTLKSVGGFVFVSVQKSVDAVQLSAPSSAIRGFAMSGFNQGLHGIVVGDDATVGTVQISDVSITGFAQGGILVHGTNANVGATIGDNVSVNANGTIGNPRSGLLVTDSAAVVIDVESPAAVGTSFSGNTSSGIEVDLQGKLDIIGLPYAALCGGTVTANNNTTGGLTFRTSPGAGGAAPPASSVNGLVACNNTRGMWVEGTAQLKVRGSVFYRNQIGIHVVASAAGGLTNPDDLSGLDLGTSADADPGKNRIQAPAGQGQNTSVGLCFNIHPNRGETLRAFGNTWMATLAASTAQTDCSANANAGAELTSVAGTSCTGAGGVSYSGQGVTGNTLAVGVCAP